MAVLQESAPAVAETVGVFNHYRDLHETVKDLGTHGFGRHQISVRGSDAALRERFGREVVPVAEIEDSPASPHSPLIGVEELGVAQGVIVGGCIYAGAALGFMHTNGLNEDTALFTLIFYTITAAMVGGVLAWVLGDQYHRFFRRQIANGGLVLWITTPDPDAQRTAEDILHRHGAHDVHLHDNRMAAAA